MICIILYLVTNGGIFIKILQVTNYFKPSWEAGGPVRATYELSKSLVQDGHKVTVYTTDGYKHRLNVETNKPVLVDGINTYYFKNLSLCFSKNMNFPLPYCAPIIIKREIQNFDVIHIHDYRTFLAAAIHHYAVKYNIPYILQPRGSMPLLGKINQKKVFDYFFGNSLVKDAKRIITSSKVESSYYYSSLPDLDTSKLIYIPNGLNIEEYCKLPEKGAFKKKYSINENDLVILSLGRIHEIKGLNILIEAYSNLVKFYDNIKLIIAGPDDGYLKKLKELVENLNLSDQIIFTGPLYEQEKIKAYVDADIFVLSSMYESFGNVVFEAIACGTPVIITDRCGVSDIVKNEAGFVIEYDPSQLFNALNVLLSDQELRERLGENGIKMVNDYFAWNKIAHSFENIYKNIS